MCVYCMIGDHHFRFDPPWQPNDPVTPWHPLVPRPAPSKVIDPWPLERLREFDDILRRVKKLEDELGCPCEPNKADYLALLNKRISALEKQAAQRARSVKGRIR